MTTATMIILIVLGVFLTISVLLQHGKSHGLSGTISGAAENFLGKERGSRVDRMLARITTVIGILFVVVVLMIYVLQPTYHESFKHQSLWKSVGVSKHYQVDPSKDLIVEKESESGTESESASAAESESAAESATETESASESASETESTAAAE